MPALRPTDHWLIEEVLPYEARYLAAARRFVKDSDEAADLVQEALVRLLAIDGRMAIANPQAYVIRSIQNIAIERMRRSKVVEFQRLTEIDMLDLRDDAPDQFRVVAARNQVARLSGIIDGLPERCRTIFVRRCLREHASRQIAADLGISLSTFDKRLARAIYLVTRALNPGDGAPEAARHEEEDDSQAIG